MAGLVPSDLGAASFDLFLSQNAPSFVRVIISPFIPLTGNGPCGPGGHGLNPSFKLHLRGFSGTSSAYAEASPVFLSSALGALYFQKPTPLVLVNGYSFGKL